MPGKDYYSVLGVARNAADKEIRQAYRRLARKHHPDVNPGDKTADARFKAINEAYEVLSDPEKRRKYDRYGDRWQYAEQFEKAGQQAGGHWFGGDQPFDLGNIDLGDVFAGDIGNIFGNILRGHRRGVGRRAQPLEYKVEITLDEAYKGTTRVVQLPVEETCTTCDGSGRIAGAACHACRGSGVVGRQRRLEVKIPAGVNDGARVRVSAGSQQEAYLQIALLPNDRFQRRGDDLNIDVLLPLEDAVLGGEAEVATLSGKKVMLRVPPLTQNGQLFRLAGLGMPRLDANGHGDLYAKIKVVLPTHLTDRERQLFEELRAMRKVSS